MRTVLMLAGLSLLAGCYERVVSERGFPGMATRANVATAPDYSQAQAQFEERYQERTESKFDPFGDFGRWVGGLFGSSEEKKPARGTGPQSTTNTPSGSTTAPSSPASGTNSSSSPFNTAP